MRDGRFVAVGGNREVTALVGPRTRVIDLRGRTVTPGLRRFARPPGLVGRSTSCTATSWTRAGSTSTWSGSRPTPRPTRTSRGSWAPAGTSPTSPTASRAGRTSTASSPIGRCSCPTRTGTTRGSTAGRWSSPASPPTRPTPTTGASPATRTARRWARSTRARRTWWSASSPRRRPRSASRRCSRARRTSTASGSRTGRTRSSRPRSTRRTARSPAEAGSRHGSPGRCGGSTTAGSTRSRASSPDEPKVPWAGMR